MCPIHWRIETGVTRLSHEEFLSKKKGEISSRGNFLKKNTSIFFFGGRQTPEPSKKKKTLSKDLFGDPQAFPGGTPGTAGFSETLFGNQKCNLIGVKVYFAAFSEQRDN